MGRDRAFTGELADVVGVHLQELCDLVGGEDRWEAVKVIRDRFPPPPVFVRHRISHFAMFPLIAW